MTEKQHYLKSWVTGGAVFPCVAGLCIYWWLFGKGESCGGWEEPACFEAQATVSVAFWNCPAFLAPFQSASKIFCKAWCNETLSCQSWLVPQKWWDLWKPKFLGWILIGGQANNMVHKQGTKGGKGGRKLSQSLSSPIGTPRTPGEERQLPLLAGSSSNNRPLGSRKASSCTLSPSIPVLPLSSSSSPPQPQVAKPIIQGHLTSLTSALS